MAKVASVETPGLREDDRQDTLTEDGQDGRYITCTDPFPKEDTHAQTHRHPYGLYSIRISVYHLHIGFIFYPIFRQDTLTEDTVDGAGLTKPQMVDSQPDEV